MIDACPDTVLSHAMFSSILPKPIDVWALQGKLSGSQAQLDASHQLNYQFLPYCLPEVIHFSITELWSFRVQLFSAGNQIFCFFSSFFLLLGHPQLCQISPQPTQLLFEHHSFLLFYCAVSSFSALVLPKMSYINRNDPCCSAQTDLLLRQSLAITQRFSGKMKGTIGGGGKSR